MKQPFRRAVSALCAFTLAASLTPSVALADGGETDANASLSSALESNVSEIDGSSTELMEPFDLDVSAEDNGIRLLSSDEFKMPLKEGKFEKWIDRVSVSDSVRNAYTVLEEASDNDGENDYLIEDQYLKGEAEVNGQFFIGRDTDGKDLPSLLLFYGSYATEDEKTQMDQSASNYLRVVFSAFSRDHAEVFWLARSVYPVCYRNSSDNAAWYGFRVGPDARSSLYPDETSLKTAISKRDENVADIIESAPPENDPEGRVRYFNEWLTKNNEYNTSDDLDSIRDSYRDAWSCVSALEGREGTLGPVCEAYSRAFKLLCDESGIPCVLVDGIAAGPSGPTGGHMWNYVKLGANWYGVDATWNDPLSGESGKLSGKETDIWLLVGADTRYYFRNEDDTISSMSFIEMHPVSNALWSDLAFPNGPELNSEKYERDCGKMGHVYNEAVVENKIAATCERNATYEEVRTCKYCGMEDRLMLEESDTALGHDLSAWAPSEAASCEAEGTEERHCTRVGCDYHETQTVSALGHSWGAWTVTTAPTCTASGTEQRTCANDVGHVETRTIPATGHALSDWEIDQIPTCTDSGTEVRRCTHAGCSYTETRTVPATGHTVTEGSVEGATCTEDGTVSGVCSVCKAVVDNEVVPGTALGHNWGAWKVTTAPTCTVSGVEERTCSRDGSHRETQVIPATGHDMGAWQTLRAATCTVPGAEVRRCAHAGCSYTETRAVAAAGHAFGAYRSNGDARVGANGTETATCSKCGAKTTRTAAGSALAPAQGQTVTAGGATYTVAGAAAVTYAGPASKAAASATVPATVTVSGRTYKVTSISPKAFAGNKKLKSVKIGANVTAIPAGAFKGCTALSKVTFGAAVKSVGSKAFYGCKSLKSVTLGAKVTSIGASAFQNCTKLTKVTVKSTKLSKVGKSAFAGCKKLKSVTLKTTKLKSVSKNALKGTAKKLVVKAPKSKVRAYQKLFKSKGSKTVRVTK